MTRMKPPIAPLSPGKRLDATPWLLGVPLVWLLRLIRASDARASLLVTFDKNLFLDRCNAISDSELPKDVQLAVRFSTKYWPCVTSMLI